MSSTEMSSNEPPATNAQPKITYTERECAARLGIGYTTLRKLRKERGVPFCRVGNRVLYREKHVERILDLLEQSPVDLPDEAA